MTQTATTVSVKIPARILARIPKAGNGRSRFIVQALEEKLAGQKAPEWKPSTQRGRRLAALLKRGESERLPLLDDGDFERELRARRGRFA
ncbi:MAG: hypothetical protein FJ387_08615 [Verrucomicrobia bacterium]|nr:hypothetical protein [Verrucomicrobiota bacterium]